MKQFSSFCSTGLLALLLLALRLPAAAQAPAWQSARAVAVATAAAAGNFSEVTATAVDAAGNVYLAGNFLNMVVLGGTTLTSLGNYGNYDVFVAKFSPASNQFLWAQRAGGTATDYVYALAVSGTNVYMAGTFKSSTAGFGSTTLTNTSFNSNDVFVAKLTDTGNFVWAQQAGGTGRDEAYALAVGGTSVYVAGFFTSPTASFGTTTISNINPNVSTDAFVAKLTDTGNMGSFTWAQRAGGAESDAATALAVSGTSVYVVGNFQSFTASFGSATLSNASTNVSTSDMFVAKLTDAGSTGSFAWAQQAGGTGDDRVSKLALSGTSLYMAGGFSSRQILFGTTILTNTVANTSTSDMFVAKLMDVGNIGSFAWAQQAGGMGDDAASTIAVSGTNVHVAGTFSSYTAGFGLTTLTNANNNTGTSDVFVSKLTDMGSIGHFTWAQRAGGTSNEYTNSLVVSGTSVYVAGSFYSPAINFGAIGLSTPNSDPLGFLASLTDPTLTPTTAGRTLPPAQLYPNPARHAATLRLPAGTAPAPLTLTDALGRSVRRYPAPASPEATLDLCGLPAGLYLLRGAGPAQRLQVE